MEDLPHPSLLFKFRIHGLNDITLNKIIVEILRQYWNKRTIEDAVNGKENSKIIKILENTITKKERIITAVTVDSREHIDGTNFNKLIVLTKK